MSEKSAQKKLMDGYNGTRSMRKQWKTVRLAVEKETKALIAACPQCQSACGCCDEHGRFYGCQHDQK